MYKLGETASSEAVSQLSARLWKAKIPHQVVSGGSKEQPTSEIWLVREEDLQLAVDILKSPESNRESSNGGKSPIVASLTEAKLTWFFLILCILVALITGLGSNISLLSVFTIVPMEMRGSDLFAGTLEGALSAGEVWRLFSPALIHLGGLHLVFNMLWVWEFGRRIEMLEGKLRLLLVVVASGVIANITQYLAGSILFGGMSGVIYALLGYMVVFDKLSSSAVYQLPRGIVGFMLVWLVLGFTQFTDALGLGKIANAAHTAGLLSGVGIALLVKWLFRS